MGYSNTETNRRNGKRIDPMMDLIDRREVTRSVYTDLAHRWLADLGEGVEEDNGQDAIIVTIARINQRNAL